MGLSGSNDGALGALGALGEPPPHATAAIANAETHAAVRTESGARRWCAAPGTARSIRWRLAGAGLALRPWFCVTAAASRYHV